MNQGDPLTEDGLTSRFRLLQRRRGHRFSIDDLMTAWVAARIAAARPPLRVLDLGAGIGSVLLMVAHHAGDAQLVGIEAQETSFALLRKNVERNGLMERSTLLLGDLRSRVHELEAGAFDLVTGTPPYLPVGTASPSPDPQRAAARLELRGGIEAYLVAAAHALSPGGLAVVCADGRTPDRSREAARRAGLFPLHALHVFAREGAPGPLFSVWTLSAGAGGPCAERVFTARDREGRRTPEAREARAFFGIPETPDV